MSKQSVTDALRQAYAQHDNDRVLQLLQAMADCIKAWWRDDRFYPDLTTDDLLLDRGTKMLAKEADKLIARAVSLDMQVEQLAQLNILPDYMRLLLHMLWPEQDVPVTFLSAFDAKWPQTLLDKQPEILREWQNIWLWDDNSAQAMVILKREQKKQLRKRQSHKAMVWRLLSTAPKLFATYKKTLRQAYRQPVALTDRIGVALHPAENYQQPEMELLESLGNIPVLIRFMSHESKTCWQNTIDYIQQLTVKKVKVSIALLQDRQAVLQPERWREFLQMIIPALHSHVEWIEVGHAVNRVKWGVWTAKEYAQLMVISDEFKINYPKLRLIGPAVIDFEWFRMIDFVKALPRKIKLFGLSQHLYVDRRGAPENFQGKFSTLEKCAMGKAVAKTLTQTEDRFIISEFNWPLKGTGIYSPIGSPYTTPDWFREDPGVSEHQYAQYLLRYLIIALTSGFVEQAFCWRLSAHGYGLVDDLDNFRPRPAFYALQFFLQLLGQATFGEKLTSADDVYLYQFTHEDKTIFAAWTTQEQMVHIAAPQPVRQHFTMLGQEQAVSQTLQLSGDVSYFVV